MSAAARMPNQVAGVDARIAFLSNPASYPDHPSSVEVRETHFAWVFLAGARAYKLKKASHLRGADWRTTEARELACREELRLNRQISASTYLAVEPLVETPSGLRIGGAGRTVDWLLVMRRLDEQRMLDAVIAAGTVTRADLDAVLQFLVSFYRSRDPLPFTAETYLRRLTARMDEALGAVQRSGTGLPPDRVEPFASELRAAVAALTPELGERATARHIAEVHGDLRAEHVCLGPPVQIIDALEVYADLRMLDTGEEIAMLALECERASSHWVPGYLRDSYRRLAADPLSDQLFDLYMALRAATQAKLAIWHLDDPDAFPDPAPWRERALNAVATARRHCQAALAPRS